MTKILYTVAKNEDGILIKAIDAEKGKSFYCPICNNALLLKKSGKTGKKTRRPHFAHKILTPNCTPETALHYTFKTMLADKLIDQIRKSLSLDISWNCIYCEEKHVGNLLKKAISIQTEFNMDICQPDIALFDKNNNVFAVIEIVVTHKPESKVLDFYKSKNIILIQINLDSDNDIFNIDSKISNPDIIDLCYNKKCNICGLYMGKKILMIIDGPCWKCDKLMKIAEIETPSGSIGPANFTQEEIKMAVSKGVILKTKFSKTIHDSYVANTCPNCNSFVGDFYLHEYSLPAQNGEYPYKTYEIGFQCGPCEDKRIQ